MQSIKSIDWNPHNLQKLIITKPRNFIYYIQKIDNFLATKFIPPTRKQFKI